MGPPPFSDGNASNVRWVNPPSMGPPSAMEASIDASMGPPPFGDGNRTNHPGSSSLQTGLQWGHRLSAMETAVMATAMAYPPSPLQWGHRLSAMETRGTASTGRPSSTCFNGATAFRRWKLAAATDDDVQAVAELQWGHRLSAMETRYAAGDARPRSTCFNGATAFRRWKRA